MAEIKLSDYVGYIFSEMVTARRLADEKSKIIAEEYAADPIMKYFSVPRFKIPEMELTIPVLISGAKFSALTVSFVYPKGRKQFVADLRYILITKYLKPEIIPKVLERKFPGKKFKDMAPAALSEQMAGQLYDHLLENQISEQQEVILTERMDVYFREVLKEGLVIERPVQTVDIRDDYDEIFTLNKPFEDFVKDMIVSVREKSTILASEIQDLLVNPVTNLVKEGSNATSVFVVKAKITEEAIFIRSISNEEKIVEFE